MSPPPPPPPPPHIFRDAAHNVFRWTYTVRVDAGHGDDDTMGELQIWLPRDDLRQNIVDTPTGHVHQVELDDMGNRVLHQEQPSGVWRVDVEEIVKVGCARALVRDLPFPMPAPVDPDPDLLSETTYVHPRDPAIAEQAKQLTEGCETVFEALLAIARFCHHSITYQVNTPGDLQSDVWCLEHRVGDCDEKSHLFMGLARSLKIPCVAVVGEVPGAEIPGHAWVEVKLGPNQWMPIDPTYSPMQVGWVDASRVMIARGIDCTHAARAAGLRYTTPGRVGTLSRSQHAVECVESLGQRQSELEVEVDTIRHAGKRVELTLRIVNPTDYAKIAWVRLISVSDSTVETDVETDEARRTWRVFPPHTGVVMRFYVRYAHIAWFGGQRMRTRCPLHLEVDSVTARKWDVFIVDGQIISVDANSHL